ncbi:TPA: helix-turn-helix transcriptional regulator [Candidatus Galligastranaerophilus intestinavium]|uniref:Helix-turn-helix transcriptional regulator n=1 Tax=Candidatus Galligastranaerophilus intestinavium TaxID=2840836 RepID=A0A9D1JX87_9BACT|nr:helix-turn-helix transcriptional regulator [Candidatus Galligastranaerophilus intestinavium]
MSIKKNLGNRIREIRISRSLTQEALAEKINLSAKSLSQIELGNNFVSAETLEKILEKLNLEPDELFSFGGIKTNDELHKNILKNLETIKSDRAKLAVVDTLLKSLL